MNIVLSQILPPGTTNSAVSPSWNWSRLLELHIEDGGLVLSLGPLLIGAVVLVGIAIFFLRRSGFGRWKHYEVVKYKLKVANLGEVEIVPNSENIRIAYQAWVELTTRKVALPFDEKNDVIVEVYDSWYQVFGRLRDLAKSIPAQRLRECADTRELVRVMIEVLNNGLRPHLTAWQAKFRRWYAVEAEKAVNQALTPQEIQRKYPDYAALVADLQQVHADVVDYAEFLRRVAQGESVKKTNG